MNKIGARILDRPAPSVSAETLQTLSALGVAQISDCMGRLYGSSGLRPLHNPAVTRLAGIALTVKTRPGDNLVIHHALEICGAGDVIVVDGGSCLANALVGELMMLHAAGKGASGFVIDGAVRDAEAFERHGFACFTRGVAHRGPYKDGPGEINVPVAVGGLVVAPGDVVLGDADGLLAIPPAYAEAVAELALAKERAEDVAKARIADGSYVKPWLTPSLERLAGEYS